jgi:hypothetical protein
MKTKEEIEKKLDELSDELVNHDDESVEPWIDALNWVLKE